jgi:hypothetical protein
MIGKLRNVNGSRKYMLSYRKKSHTGRSEGSVTRYPDQCETHKPWFILQIFRRAGALLQDGHITQKCGLERLGITHGLIVALLPKHQTGLRIDKIAKKRGAHGDIFAEQFA